MSPSGCGAAFAKAGSRREVQAGRDLSTRANSSTQNSRAISTGGPRGHDRHQAKPDAPSPSQSPTRCGLSERHPSPLQSRRHAHALIGRSKRHWAGRMRVDRPYGPRRWARPTTEHSTTKIDHPRTRANRSPTSPSVVSQSDGSLFSAARARLTFSRMSSAFLVQTKVFGLALWCLM